MTQKKDDILYGCEDCERLYDDPFDALMEHLDGSDMGDLQRRTVEVREYRRVTAKLDPEMVLEFALEHLDERYSMASDTYISKPTDAMREAAKVFCAAILSEYVPYDCMPTGKREMINVLEWVRENAPEWLEREDHE